MQNAEDPLTGEPRVMVSIFMNVFNIAQPEVARGGRRREVKYTPGLFLNADLDKASTDNERNAVRVRMEDGRASLRAGRGLDRPPHPLPHLGGREARPRRACGFIASAPAWTSSSRPRWKSPVTIGQKVTGVMSTIAPLITSDPL